MKNKTAVRVFGLVVALLLAIKFYEYCYLKETSFINLMLGIAFYAASMQEFDRCYAKNPDKIKKDKRQIVVICIALMIGMGYGFYFKKYLDGIAIFFLLTFLFYNIYYKKL